jgi:hypothetical protein
MRNSEWFEYETNVHRAAEKKEEAIREIRKHAARFAWTTLRRIVFTWTGY